MNQLEQNRAGTAFWVVFSGLHLLLGLLLVAVLLPCGRSGKAATRGQVPVRAGTPPHNPERTYGPGGLTYPAAAPGPSLSGRKQITGGNAAEQFHHVSGIGFSEQVAPVVAYRVGADE